MTTPLTLEEMTDKPLTLAHIEAVEKLCVLTQEEGDYADKWILPALCAAARAALQSKGEKE
jgi:hypothetical protein